MKLFQKKNAPKSAPELIGAQRGCAEGFDLPAAVQPYEKELYDRLRCAVPIIDAAIMKIIRLTGGFHVVCRDKSFQQELDSFLAGVPVGLTGRSVGCFADNFLYSLLTYGRAVGEIVTDNEQRRIAGLWNGDISKIRISSGTDPFSRSYELRAPDGTSRRIAHPERIVYAELTGGNSLLRGLPSLSGILMRIYQCIGQNYDRAGNIRYAVTYKPTGEASDVMFTRERAQQIAREWADGMNSAKYGQVKDFVAVGDVDIKVIGAENQLFDTNVPVRQILEQLIAKLSIPPFLLGLSWSSTERMSSQQALLLSERRQPAQWSGTTSIYRTKQPLQRQG